MSEDTFKNTYLFAYNFIRNAERFPEISNDYKNEKIMSITNIFGRLGAEALSETVVDDIEYSVDCNNVKRILKDEYHKDKYHDYTDMNFKNPQFTEKKNYFIFDETPFKTYFDKNKEENKDDISFMKTLFGEDQQNVIDEYSNLNFKIENGRLINFGSSEIPKLIREFANSIQNSLASKLHNNNLSEILDKNFEQNELIQNGLNKITVDSKWPYAKQVSSKVAKTIIKNYFDYLYGTATDISCVFNMFQQDSNLTSNEYKHIFYMNKLISSANSILFKLKKDIKEQASAAIISSSPSDDFTINTILNETLQTKIQTAANTLRNNKIIINTASQLNSARNRLWSYKITRKFKEGGYFV